MLLNYGMILDVPNPDDKVRVPLEYLLKTKIHTTNPETGGSAPRATLQAAAVLDQLRSNQALLRDSLAALSGPFLVFDAHGEVSQATEALLEEIFATECDKLMAITVICSVTRQFYQKDAKQRRVKLSRQEKPQRWQKLLVRRLCRSELSILQVTLDKAKKQFQRYKCQKNVREL